MLTEEENAAIMGIVHEAIEEALTNRETIERDTRRIVKLIIGKKCRKQIR